jgi:hypothetical protein
MVVLQRIKDGSSSCSKGPPPPLQFPPSAAQFFFLLQAAFRSAIWPQLVNICFVSVVCVGSRAENGQAAAITVNFVTDCPCLQGRLSQQPRSTHPEGTSPLNLRDLSLAR